MDFHFPLINFTIYTVGEVNRIELGCLHSDNLENCKMQLTSANATKNNFVVTFIICIFSDYLKVHFPVKN